MIVAEITLTEASNFESGHLHVVKFDDLAKAKAEYARIVDLFDRKEKRANDLPNLLTVAGASNEVTLPLDHIRSVGLSDYAHANEQAAGVRDAFPHLFKK